MTAERDSMTLNEVSVPALGVEERSDEAPRAGRARPTPDPEVVAKPKRRQFTAEYRLRILEEADRCTQPGEVGRLDPGSQGCRSHAPLRQHSPHADASRRDQLQRRRQGPWRRPDGPRRVAQHRPAQGPQEPHHHPAAIALARSEPVENIWQYLRQNWLSNRVFEDYDAIIEAGCQAWNKLIDQPETIMSIGMRDWAISGQ